MIPAGGTASYSGGFPVQPFDGIGLIAHGRDANGHELAFYGYAVFAE